MNTRARQKIKAELRRENPDVMATLKTVRLKDDTPVSQIIFVPRSEIRAYKERYGGRIEFWEVEEDAACRR
jgi:hypothetical protein